MTNKHGGRYWEWDSHPWKRRVDDEENERTYNTTREARIAQALYRWDKAHGTEEER